MTDDQVHLTLTQTQTNDVEQSESNVLSPLTLTLVLTKTIDNASLCIGNNMLLKLKNEKQECRNQLSSYLNEMVVNFIYQCQWG